MFWKRTTSQDLNDLGNWYDDFACSTPSAGLPTGSDDATILGNAGDEPTSNSGLAGVNSWNSSFMGIGTVITSTVTNGMSVVTAVTLGVSGDPTSVHRWSGSAGSMGTSSVDLRGGAIFTVNSGDSIGNFSMTDSSQMGGSGATLTIGGASTISGSATIYADDLTINGSGSITTSNSPSLGAAGSGTNLTIGGTISLVIGGTPTLGSGLVVGTTGGLTLADSAEWDVDATVGALAINDTASATGGTITCTTATLASPKAVNGATINNSGALTGSQTGGSGGGGLLQSGGMTGGFHRT